MTEQTEKVVKKFLDEELSDVCLVVDNTEFHAHKMILACHSKVFKAMFYGDFKEKNEERIEIADVDPIAFQRMLELIYEKEMSDDNFLKCSSDVSSDEFWNQSTTLWQAMDRFDTPSCVKLFGNILKQYCCPMKFSPVSSSSRAYTCSRCSGRFVFAAVHGIPLPEGIHSSALKGWQQPTSLPPCVLNLIKLLAWY